MRTTGLRSIARKYGLRAIVMFGSRARGTPRRNSDCDICVSAPRLRGDEVELAYELSQALHEDVDLCIFERVGPSLMHTIALEGNLLYGSRNIFDRMRLRGIREWQDARKVVDATRAYLDRMQS